MSTEYRRGISREHIEAATRLGFLWRAERNHEDYWRFGIVGDEVQSVYDNRMSVTQQSRLTPCTDEERTASYRPIRPDGTPVDWEVLDAEVARVQRETVGPSMACNLGQPTPEPRRFADVRPDRHGWRWWRLFGSGCPAGGSRIECNRALGWRIWSNYHDYGETTIPTDEQGNPVSWESIAQPAPTTAPTQPQPQGFRADLWRRICAHFTGREVCDMVSFDQIVSLNDTACHFTQWYWDWRDMPAKEASRTDILTRWTVYQELKPLYDIVDGAQGEAPMPEDVERAWVPGFSAVGYHLSMTTRGLCASGPDEHDFYVNDGTSPGQRLRNFAAVLDAVAEQRVAARQGQPQTVTATVAPGVSAQAGTLMMQTPEGARPGTWALQSAGRSVRAAQLEPAAPQPSYFAADGDTVSTPAAAPPWLHQMCAEMRATASWQRADGLHITFCLPYGRKLTQGQLDRVRRNINPPGDIDAVVTRFTVAATNQPAPPVPVCLVAKMRRNQDLAVLSPDDSIPGERDAAVAWAQLDDTTSQLCRNVVRDIVEHGCYGLDDAAAARRASVYHELIAEAQSLGVEVAAHVRAWCSQLQTRTALLDLDDVDHSQSTTLDSAPLKRGKLPTAEQIGKYREVMSRRSGTVAEALKASGIDCEVAQYVLERWAGGLSDETALWLLRDVGKYCRPGQSFTCARINELAEQAIERPALDTSGPADGTAQRQREEREAQRQRMAALQAQLAAERAALRAEPQPEPARLALLECDPEANPAASIAAWEARMAQRSVQRSVQLSVRQAPVQRPQPQPQQPMHRRPFEVVDAQADGLTGGAALAVLLGRAMNGGC